MLSNNFTLVTNINIEKYKKNYYEKLLQFKLPVVVNLKMYTCKKQNERTFNLFVKFIVELHKREISNLLNASRSTGIKKFQITYELLYTKKSSS